MLLAKLHLRRTFEVVNESGQHMKQIARFVMFGSAIDVYDDEE